MKNRTPLALAVGSALLLAGGAQAADNLIVNGNAETGDLTGWTDTSGRGYASTQVEVYEGTFSFHGGLSGPDGPYDHEITQDVDVAAGAVEIDAGDVICTFQCAARTNSAGSWNDNARVIVEFRGGTGAVLATYDSGDVRPVNTWIPLQDLRTVPTGTRAIRVRLVSNRAVGASTDGFHDAVALTLQTTSDVEGASWGGIKARFRD